MNRSDLQVKWVQKPVLSDSRACMSSPATVPTMQAMTAGTTELSVEGSDNSEKVAGGNGGGRFGPIEGDQLPAGANSSEEGNLLTPMSNSWRGKHSGQTVYEGFRSPVVRNVCIGSTMPVDSHVYHTEQHVLDVDREVVSRHNNEARNIDTSANCGRRGSLGNDMGRNNMDRNGGSVPVKS